MAEGTPAGWYPDPEQAGQLRWWTGRTWGDDRKPAQPVHVEQRQLSPARVLMALSALGLVLGALLPWTKDRMLVPAISGMDISGGRVTAGAGLALALLSLGRRRLRWVPALLVGLIAGFVSFGNVRTVEVYNERATLSSIQVGQGLWLSCLASLLAISAAVWTLVDP